MFYLRLAYTNLKKNKTAFVPFCVATIFTVILNVIVQVILKNQGMNDLPQAMAVKSMLDFGNVVIMIFSVIFIFYTHSFVIKRRKKELSLYNILGMNKQNLTFMMFVETLMTMVFVLITGILSGVVVSKLMFLVLKKLTRFGDDFIFELNLSSIVQVCLLFLGIFLVVFLYDVWQVRKSKPIELLGQASSGEKEPKAKWIFAILGLGCLGAGYWISLSIKSPIDALVWFFVAVILVIIGTYGLFVAGSVTLLKVLKRNKKFYYKPTNFISVSNMMFRMKQNGAGLATICILCTMALVTISTTVCLYAGQEESLQLRNPLENVVETTRTVGDAEALIDTTAEKHHVNVSNLEAATQSSRALLVKEGDGEFVRQQNINFYTIGSALTDFSVMQLSEYNRLEHKDESLNDNEVLVYQESGAYRSDKIILGTETFAVKSSIASLKSSPEQSGYGSEEGETLVVIIPDDMVNNSKLAALWQSLYDDEQAPKTIPLQNKLFFSISGDTQDKVDFGLSMKEELADEDDFGSSFIDLDRENNYAFIGGFLFIGIIFGVSFLLATTLIIFYKQISEGNDDQARFDIMQKVGLSHKEVKKSIHKQIILIFFLPIFMAILHLLFAFPMIQKLLVLFGITNNLLLVGVTAASVGIFTLGYLLIYWQTSKVYYRLVERTV